MQTKKAQRKQKSTTQTKKHNANKKAQCKQKSATQTKKHNANKKAQRKQKSSQIRQIGNEANRETRVAARGKWPKCLELKER